MVIYDESCRGWPWLTQSWEVGSALARARGCTDATAGFTGWAEAIEWLAGRAEAGPIGEVQFWGHGKWGEVFFARDALDASALDDQHPLHEGLARIRRAMNDQSRWWFRSCETFGARRGQTFARRWVDFFGCEAVGHTFIIGPWQSGLHRLRPGRSPDWDPREGLLEGDAEAPRRAAWSRAWRPNTVFCLRMDVPADLG